MNPFVERHQGQITAVLCCFDRIVITGTLPEIALAEGVRMTPATDSRGD
jgi:hypothetical protein